MATLNLRLNKDAFAFAQELIKQGKFTKNKKIWEKEKPTEAQEDQFLTTHAWHNYGLWFLAINCEESQGTKAYYTFPLGNFQTIYYSALLAAQNDAQQNNNFEIVEAAITLCKLIDEQA